MIFIISTVVFLTVVLFLVGMLLLVEARVTIRGERDIMINDDIQQGIRTPVGKTLLAALTENGIHLPSACGGKGTCGTCRCRVEEGGGDFLPTELSHLSRKEKGENIRIACQVKVRNDMRIHIPPEIFMIKLYHATVVSNNNVATFIKELVLQLDSGEILEFKAGAYVQIDIPEYETIFSSFGVADRYKKVWEQFGFLKLTAKSDEPVYRAYSLANPPGEKSELTFTVRIATPPLDDADIPPGVGSSFLFHLRPGDRVTLTGPYGDFFVKETAREMCFIGGGAGMAPMRSHIFHQLMEVKTDRKVTFWYGARSRQEMFYDENFSRLDEGNENFSYHVALSDPQPEDAWKGLVGFIHERVYDQYLSSHPDPTEIEYYLCGPPPMVDAVVKMLDDLGVEPEMIAFDTF